MNQPTDKGAEIVNFHAYLETGSNNKQPHHEPVVTINNDTEEDSALTDFSMVKTVLKGEEGNIVAEHPIPVSIHDLDHIFTQYGDTKNGWVLFRDCFGALIMIRKSAIASIWAINGFDQEAAKSFGLMFKEIVEAEDQHPDCTLKLHHDPEAGTFVDLAQQYKILAQIIIDCTGHFGKQTPPDRLFKLTDEDDKTSLMANINHIDYLILSADCLRDTVDHVEGLQIKFPVL